MGDVPMFFSWYFSPSFPNDFPRIVACFSHRCPMIFPWFCHDFPMICAYFPIRTSQFSPYLTALCLCWVFVRPRSASSRTCLQRGCQGMNQTNWKITIFHGKIHSFDWAMASIVFCKRLPEATPIALWRIFCWSSWSTRWPYHQLRCCPNILWRTKFSLQRSASSCYVIQDPTNKSSTPSVLASCGQGMKQILQLVGYMSPIYLRSGWWFGTWFFWLSVYWEESSQLTFIFFRGLKTTNQMVILIY